MYLNRSQLVGLELTHDQFIFVWMSNIDFVPNTKQVYFAETHEWLNTIVVQN